jgi:vitamin B12 transporter
MKRRLAGLMLGALAGGAAAEAQQVAPAGDTLPRFELEPVVVTARRYPALREELPQRFRVLDRRDLEHTPAEHLVDVLKKTAGVEVIQYPSLLAGIGIRGFRPEFGGINTRTLVLVDGRPAGAANLATFDVGQLERVEVMKGPGSALHGSSAMGGVVNLVTRESRERVGGRIGMARGSWRTREASARAGGAIAHGLDFDADVAVLDQGEDYRLGRGNLLRGWVGSDSVTKHFADGREARLADPEDGRSVENSRYGYRTASARLGYAVDPRWRVDLRAEGFRADEVQTPADLLTSGQGGLKNVRRGSTEARLSGDAALGGPLLRVFSANDDFDYLSRWSSGSYPASTTATATRGGQAQGSRAIRGHLVTAGLDHTRRTSATLRWDSLGTRLAPWSPDAGVYSSAGFAETLLRLPAGATATLGARLDRIVLDLRETPHLPEWEPASDAFLALNPSAGLSVPAGVGFRLHGSLGRAFVAPEAFHRAGRAVVRGPAGSAAVTVGNGDVAPERSLTWDAGVELARPALGLEADLTYYSTTVSRRITSVRASFPAEGRPRMADGTEVSAVTTYVNAHAARIEGIEASLGYDLGAARGWRRSLRAGVSGNRTLRAVERVSAPSVDAAVFAGRDDFRPSDVRGALSFAAPGEVRIRNVAERTLTGHLEYDDLRRFSARLGARYVGERMDADFVDWMNPGDVLYPAFGVVDARAELRVRSRYRLALEAANLTDENYYESRGSNLPGRTLKLRLGIDL